MKKIKVRQRTLRLFRSRGKVARALPLSSQFNTKIRTNGAGGVIVGESVSFGYSLAPRYGEEILLQARYNNSKIWIGDGVEFSNGVSLIAIDEIKIGKHCLIADSVQIFDSDFHDLQASNRFNMAKRLTSDGVTAPVEIEENVWLCSRVLVLKGVTVGKNSVIGAGSIVVNDIPPNVLAAGAPAKVIRQLD